MSSNELKINLDAEFGEIDEDTKQKVINFTNALSELPHDLHIPVKALMDGEGYGNDLKFNIGSLLVEQVKEHFSFEDEE